MHPFLQLKSGGTIICGPAGPVITSITIDDVTTALDVNERWRGQLGFWGISVLRHSYLVSKILESLGEHAEIQLAGLLHDAHEAITGDIPTPIKKYIPGVRDLEENLQRQICKCLDLDFLDFDLSIIRYADRASLVCEAMRHDDPTEEFQQWIKEESEIVSNFLLNEARDVFRNHCNAFSLLRADFLDRFEQLKKIVLNARGIK